MTDGEQRWVLANTALSLLRVDPSLKGMLVRASHGPVQQAFLTRLSEYFATTSVPVSVSLERLKGGLDISQTLANGKPVYQNGLLDTTSGALLVTGAQRLDTLISSTLSSYLDNSKSANTVLVVMDESTEDETGLADSPMADRLAMMIELPSLPLSTLKQLTTNAQPEESDANLVTVDVELSDSLLKEITLLALRLGVTSIRLLLYAVRVARAHAALNDRLSVELEDAAIAAQLVLAPRATTMDPMDEKADEHQDDHEQDAVDEPDEASDSQRVDQPDPPEQNPDDDETNHSEDVGEQLLEAVSATLPQHLIANLVRGQKNNRKAGRDAGATGKGTTGRPTGVRRPRGSLYNQRLSIIETLKAAAPKQKLRNKEGKSGQRLRVRVEDFRVTRFKQPTRTTTVFVVDASGSAALNRLAEAKGAVELLLAECYVRRDRVALISFRGTEARLELPPTRSLVRAKRELAGLPGGGGTPLASGLELASQVAQQLKQAGETPVIVVMTDGKANITSLGEASRTQAMDDAHRAARQLATLQIKCLFIDTAPRARPLARELAASLNATYLPLPSTSSSKLPELIRA
ncbi:MAG: VWA domain-containing protein [Granulosicoccus sp.]